MPTFSHPALRSTVIVQVMASVGLCTAAGLAQAQSNVVIWGVMDSAVRHVNNEARGSIYSVVSGSNSTSRLSVRGMEDMGGGWSAGFHLEHGLLVDTGSQVAATMFWDRRATVSLIGKDYGEIRAGRDFTPSYNNWGRYDPFSYVGAAAANVFVSATPVGPLRSAFGTGVNTTVRTSNAVQYLLPSGWSGLEGGITVAAGEGGTAANGQHKLVGVRLGWSGGGYGVSAAHTRTENDLTTASALTDSVIGGNASIGPVKLTGAYRQFKYADARQRILLLGAVIQVGAAGDLKLSMNRSNMSGRVGTTSIGANDARQFAIGYVHNLSKRTALYATLSRIDNDGAATYAVPGGPTGLAGGATSTGVEFGIRHNF